MRFKLPVPDHKRHMTPIYLLQAMAILPIWLVMRLLPFPMASALGEWLLVRLGPRLKLHQHAKNNLHLIYPDMTNIRRAQILRDMWSNLGRNFGESAHQKKFFAAGKPNCTMSTPQVTIKGYEHIQKCQDENIPYLVAGLHAANWEIVAAVLWARGSPLHVVFRPPNNGFAGWILDQLIRRHVSKHRLPKNPQIGRTILKAFKNKQGVGWLIDQRESTGENIPFLGKSALTSVLPAQLAIRSNAAIIPMTAFRHKGTSHIEITLHPPLTYQQDDQPIDIMKNLYDLFSEFVHAHPEQWLWVHRRWKR